MKSSIPRIGDVNTPVSTGKSKYGSQTDSVLVSRAKVEKFPERGVKRPEITQLQPARAQKGSGAQKRPLERVVAMRLNQRSSVLLEARARELACVAKRKLKRKQAHAGNEVRPMKMGSVTHARPEADVIYFRARRSQLDSWWRPSTVSSIF